jgi:hypothetical protein
MSDRKAVDYTVLRFHLLFLDGLYVEHLAGALLPGVNK